MAISYIIVGTVACLNKYRSRGGTLKQRAAGQVRRVALQQAPPARPEERTVLQLHSARGTVARFSLGRLHAMVACRSWQLTLNLDSDAGDPCSLYTASLLAVAAQAAESVDSSLL